MRTISTLFAAALLLASCGMFPAFAASVSSVPPLVNTEVDASNVLVNRGCSGTIIAPEHVLTASHCVLDQFKDVEHDTVDPKTGKVTKETVRVAVPGTVAQLTYASTAVATIHRVVFKVAAIDRDRDLALLTLAAPLGTPMHVGCVPPERGDTVFAIGNPMGVLYASLSEGIVGSTTRSYRDLAIAGQLGDLTDDGDHGLIQHTALIAPGSSGGALVDGNGDLIGVNVRGGMGFSFAVPLPDVRAFLSANGEAAPVTCSARRK